jgi:hypothetical protein
MRESIGAGRALGSSMVPVGNSWLDLQHCSLPLLQAHSLWLARGIGNNAGFAISHVPNIPLS